MSVCRNNSGAVVVWRLLGYRLKLLWRYGMKVEQVTGVTELFAQLEYGASTELKIADVVDSGRIWVRARS